MASIDQFCESMRHWCCDMDMHYDQGNRWNFTYSGSADCSSTIIHCLDESGFGTGGATYTGNMSSNLCARGWDRVANDGNPQRGDILLNDVNHVGMWDGSYCIEFGGDPHEGYSTMHGYYDYPWDCYLRYTEEEEVGDYATAQLYPFEVGDKASMVRFIKDGDYYRIQNKVTGKYLAYAGGRTDNGTEVCWYTETGADDQLWERRVYRKFYDKPFDLRPKLDTTKRITTRDEGQKYDQLMLWDDTGTGYGRWNWVYGGKGAGHYGYMLNRASCMCLNDKDGK